MPVMCGKQAHQASFYFCEYCAKKQLDINIVFFCSECNFTKKKIHVLHTDQLMQLSSDKFSQPLAQIKSAIYKQVQQTKARTTNPSESDQIIINIQNQKQLAMLKLINQNRKLSTLLIDEQIIRWLIKVKFWQGRDKNTIHHFETKIKLNVKQKLEQNQEIKKIFRARSRSRSPINRDRFQIQWPKNNIGQMVQAQIESLNVENRQIKKQTDICNLVIKLFTSFNSQQLYQAEEQCQDLLKKYPQSKVLYLSLIRINQLLPNGNNSIPKILQEIIKKVDKNFQSTDMYHYYMAMSHWQLIEKQQNHQQHLWFELKNKRYYKLVKPEAYITSLIKAIAVRQKPAYYISLGIGYIVKENYQQALNVFKQASSMLNKRNDALDLNKFWAQIKYQTNDLQFESIMENLETRTMQFITNICKHFKNSKKYSQLVECCEELISRQPERWNFKIQFIKSILFYSSTVNQFNQDDHERLSRADKMIEELKIAEDKQASKLQKRLTRVRALNDIKNDNLNKASEGFYTLTKNTKLASGSDFYNYAGTQFALFIQNQCTDEYLIKQAYENIKKALQLKPNKIKYKKLKFFVCSYMNLFNEAYHSYEELRKVSPSEINTKEYERLIQFVKDNMEMETPGM